MMSQLDLFRYGSAGTINWSTQGPPYFSIDGAKTSCSAIRASRLASRTVMDAKRRIGRTVPPVRRNPASSIPTPASARCKT